MFLVSLICLNRTILDLIFHTRQRILLSLLLVTRYLHISKILFDFHIYTSFVHLKVAGCDMICFMCCLNCSFRLKPVKGRRILHVGMKNVAYRNLY